jgi:metal-sulfur cluster biosynthetic enzyme
VSESETVRLALRAVVDPCSIATGVPIDLLDMGLVKRVEVAAGVATVELRVTSPMCTQIGLIRERIDEVIGGLRGIEQVVIEVDARAEWWPEMMAPDARARLRAVRPLPVVPVPSRRDVLAE